MKFLYLKLAVLCALVLVLVACGNPPQTTANPTTTVATASSGTTVDPPASTDNWEEADAIPGNSFRPTTTVMFTESTTTVILNAADNTPKHIQLVIDINDIYAKDYHEALAAREAAKRALAVWQEDCTKLYNIVKADGNMPSDNTSPKSQCFYGEDDGSDASRAASEKADAANWAYTAAQDAADAADTKFDNDGMVSFSYDGILQLGCSDTCPIQVKFDNGKTQNFSVAWATVNGSHWYIVEATDFMTQLLNAQKVAINLPITGIGYQEADFNVSGF